MTVSTAFKNNVRQSLLTHEFMGMDAIMKKTSQTRHHLNRVLRALIAEGWVVYEKNGRDIKYRTLKARAAPMKPLRDMSNSNSAPRGTPTHKGTSRKAMLVSTLTLHVPGHRPFAITKADADALYDVLKEHLGYS